MRQEMIEFWDGSGISWTICKQSARRSRQITTSLNFYRLDALPDARQQCHSTASDEHSYRARHRHCHLRPQRSVVCQQLLGDLALYTQAATHSTHPINSKQLFTGRMLLLQPNQQCQSTEGM